MSSNLSSTGYGAIPRNESNESCDSESSPLMEDTSTSKGVFNIPKCSLCVKRTSRLIVGALVGILVVFLGGGARIPRGGGSIRTNHHFDYPEGIEKEEPGRLQDFSSLVEESFQVSPMEDMGMLGLEREYDALPSSVWGSHLEKEGHPLPTNSWYLVSLRWIFAFLYKRNIFLQTVHLTISSFH